METAHTTYNVNQSYGVPLDKQEIHYVIYFHSLTHATKNLKLNKDPDKRPHEAL